MKPRMVAAILFAGGILIGVSTSELIHAQAAKLATKQIFQTDLNNLPGQEVLLFASTWQPATPCRCTCIRKGTRSPT